MNIELLAAGTKPPAWIGEGFREYEKRLPKDWKLQLKEIKVAKRTKTTSIARLKQDEGDRMLDAIQPGALVVAMDSGGEIWSTEQLADRLNRWRQEFPLVQLMIGGPDGLDPRCLARANETWSMSRLTFPHFVVRLLVSEQVYRAWSVINNHPYHK